MAELGGVAVEEAVGDLPFHEIWATKPMNRMPVRPAVPWAASTSSVSSTRVRGRQTMIA